VGQGALELAVALGVTSAELESADVAVFLVSAKDGIVRADSDKWLVARDLYIPSIVVITDLSATNETDFEDMAAIAGRILDPVVTPYLVLHQEDGSPIALIDLLTQKIRDYSTGVLVHGDSEHEHQDVVSEFRDEYQELIEATGEEAFENGLLYPAIPWIQGGAMGLLEIADYLNRIPITR
jgi:translation elongation factor EF-G